MELTKYKEALGEEAFSQLQEYVQTLINQKEEARQESITGRKSLKAEVTQLRELKEKLYDKLGLDEDANIDELQIPTKGSELEATKQFERKLKKLEQDLKERNEAYQALDSKYQGTLTQAALQKAISGHDFVDQDLVSEYVKARIKVEEGELVYVDGDKVMSVDEGVKLIAQTKPHMLRAQGQGGSGFNPTSTSGKVKSLKEMTLTERMELARTDMAAYQRLEAGVAA